mmetsp:Transcript_1763/g.3238  ORF Transcript_1763/g.3238 Transcript_1763/m.3238 type:complete len:832 (+) Transcript_1763:1849-4344(+)
MLQSGAQGNKLMGALQGTGQIHPVVVRPCAQLVHDGHGGGLTALLATVGVCGLRHAWVQHLVGVRSVARHGAGPATAPGTVLLLRGRGLLGGLRGGLGDGVAPVVEAVDVLLDGDDVQLPLLAQDAVAGHPVHPLRARDDARVTQLGRQAVRHGLRDDDGAAHLAGQGLHLHHSGADLPGHHVLGHPHAPALGQHDLAEVQAHTAGHDRPAVEDVLESLPQAGTETDNLFAGSYGTIGILRWEISGHTVSNQLDDLSAFVDDGGGARIDERVADHPNLRQTALLRERCETADVRGQHDHPSGHGLQIAGVVACSQVADHRRWHVRLQGDERLGELGQHVLQRRERTQHFLRGGGQLERGAVHPLVLGGHVHHHGIPMPGVRADLHVHRDHGIAGAFEGVHKQPAHVQQRPGDVQLGVAAHSHPLDGGQIQPRHRPGGEGDVGERDQRGVATRHRRRERKLRNHRQAISKTVSSVSYPTGHGRQVLGRVVKDGRPGFKGQGFVVPHREHGPVPPGVELVDLLLHHRAVQLLRPCELVHRDGLVAALHLVHPKALQLLTHVVAEQTPDLEREQQRHLQLHRQRRNSGGGVDTISQEREVGLLRPGVAQQRTPVVHPGAGIHQGERGAGRLVGAQLGKLVADRLDTQERILGAVDGPVRHADTSDELGDLAPGAFDVLDAAVDESGQDISHLLSQSSIRQDARELDQVDEGDNDTHRLRWLLVGLFTQKQHVSSVLGQVGPHTGERPGNLKQNRLNRRVLRDIVDVGILHMPVTIHTSRARSVCQHNTGFVTGVLSDLGKQEIQVLVSTFDDLEEERRTVKQEPTDTDFTVPQS